MSVVSTRCSTGIEKATALTFALRCDRVYATMRGPESGVELQKLTADDPCKPMSEAIEQFVRARLAAAPGAVADLVTAYADGAPHGVHHPGGVPGLEPSPGAVRSPALLRGNE